MVCYEVVEKRHAPSLHVHVTRDCAWLTRRCAPCSPHCAAARAAAAGSLGGSCSRRRCCCWPRCCCCWSQARNVDAWAASAATALCARRRLGEGGRGGQLPRSAAMAASARPPGSAQPCRGGTRRVPGGLRLLLLRRRRPHRRRHRWGRLGVGPCRGATRRCRPCGRDGHTEARAPVHPPQTAPGTPSTPPPPPPECSRRRSSSSSSPPPPPPPPLPSSSLLLLLLLLLLLRAAARLAGPSRLPPRWGLPGGATCAPAGLAPPWPP